MNRTKPETIAIIQLARMGDLVQTLPLLRALRRQRPEAEISLLVDTRNEELARRLKCVDLVFPVDPSRLLGRNTRSGKALVEGYRCAENWLAPIREKRFEVVYNLNFSLLTCLLALLLRPLEVRGFGPGKDGSPVPLDPWSAYLLTAVSHRRLNRINLIDLFLGLAHGNPDEIRIQGELPSLRTEIRILHEERRWAEEWLAARGAREGGYLVGLQLGAGSDARKWPTASFARLARMIIEKGGTALLLGGPGEEALGDEVRGGLEDHHRSRVINGIGQTSIGELAALLERCGLLISNNTGTMHLAAALETKIIALFIGPAYCFETGPRGDGHLVLQTELSCSPCTDEWASAQCSHRRCRNDVTPEFVFDLVEQTFLQEAPIVPRGCPSEVGVYISRVQRGWVRYFSLIRRPALVEQIASLCYEEMWKMTLAGQRSGGNWADGEAEGERRVVRQLRESCFPPTEEVRRDLVCLSKSFAVLAKHWREVAPTLDGVSSRGFLQEIRLSAPIAAPLVDSWVQGEGAFPLPDGELNKDGPRVWAAWGAAFMERCLSLACSDRMAAQAEVNL